MTLLGRKLNAAHLRHLPPPFFPGSVVDKCTVSGRRTVSGLLRFGLFWLLFIHPLLITAQLQ